jgi:hypothetical protein
MALGTFLCLCFLAVPLHACPQEWTNCFCSDNETLFLYEDIAANSPYLANTSMECAPYACNNITRTCANPYEITAVQASFGLPLFLVLAGVALGSLIWGITGKKYLLCMLATILFAVLALQSIALETVFANTMLSSFTSIFVGGFWLATAASFLATLIGMLVSLKNKGN